MVNLVVRLTRVRVSGEAVFLGVCWRVFLETGF